MKIAVICNSDDLNSYQIKDLMKKADVLKINLDILSLKQFYLESNNSQSLERLKNYNAIYYRVEGTPVIRNLYADYCFNKNLNFINSAYYHSPLCGNKLKQIYEVSKLSKIVAIPETIVYEPSQEIEKEYNNIIKKIGTPFIAKPIIGRQGIGVKKISTIKNYLELIKNIASPDSIMFQEFIENNGDYRVFVMGNEIAAIMNRIPSQGDFRANISQGAKGLCLEKNTLYSQLSEIAIKISQHFSLQISGIDLMISTKNEQIYFIETNSMPQWEGISQICNVDIAKKIIKYLIDSANSKAGIV